MGEHVAIDLVGGASAKGKLKAVDEDFLILHTSGSGEIYVALDKITKIWQTL